MVQFCKEGRKEKGWVVCPSLPQDSCNLFLGVLGVITTAGGGVEKGKDNYDVSCPENNSFLLFSSLPPTASIFFSVEKKLKLLCYEEKRSGHSWQASFILLVVSRADLICVISARAHP